MAKSSRLEVRQLRGTATPTTADAGSGIGVDSFPVVLQLPIHGRITALEPLRIPRMSTAAIFMLLDRNQYAVISYHPSKHHPPPSTLTSHKSTKPTKVNPYPVVTHASGSLDGNNNNNNADSLVRPTDTGTIVAVDPHCRCIAIHCYDGLLSVLPVDLRYVAPAATVLESTDEAPRNNTNNKNPRRPKQLLGTPFHCRLEENVILAMTFLPTASGNDDTDGSGSPSTASSSPSPPTVLLLAILYQDARGAQHVTTHAINIAKQQMHFYGSQSVPTGPVPWLKKSSVDGGSAILIPMPYPLQQNSSTTTKETMGTAEENDDEGMGNSNDGGKEGSMMDHFNASTKPGPAVIVVGQRQLTYCSSTTTKILPVPQALFLTYTDLPADPETGLPRYLLADELCNLHMLSLRTVHNRVVALQFETLGSCTLATALCYLRDGLLFVGSSLGDSQLVQISDEPIVMEQPAVDTVASADEIGSDALMETTYLTILEEYQNLGPILDFDLVPTAPRGAPLSLGDPQHHVVVQSQVVTASGSSKSGSIRVVRNGIGMNEYAAVEIPGIQAMWRLRPSYAASDDAYLVQSFVGETRVLGVVMASNTYGGDAGDNDDMLETPEDEEEMGGTLEEVVLPGLDPASSSLYIGNVQHGNRILQITDSQIRLVSWSGELVSEWTGQITVAAANEAGQIVVALQGGVVVYLIIEGDEIKKALEKQMDREVSCLNIHPFAAKELVNSATNAMEIDSEETVRASPKSSLVAVGMWDDFTVRLLSVEKSLIELVCISLGTVDDDIDIGEGPSSRNRNNMMARSLCLITLDFSSSAGGTDEKGSSGPGVDMLFVGLGDGTLVSFAVVADRGTVSVQSKKDVCLGTQRIDLVPLNTEQGGSCVLATGDRPTVIYLAGVGGTAHHSNPKLCYSNVNVATNDGDEMDDISRPPSHQSITVNVAAPFFSPLLFDSASFGKQHYSLCVADDTSLRLGVIDDIQKLHVTTCRLGMAPRRIVHCVDGRLFAVGCIESGIQNFGLGGDEANMGNCIRFMDDTTFDDLEKVDLDPYEMILSMIYISLKTPKSAKDSSDAAATTASNIVYKPFLLVGTAYALPDEDEPSRGRILVYSCQEDNVSAATSSNRRAIRQITEFSTEGGVYSMCQFYEGKFLVTVNTRTHLCEFIEDTGMLQLRYVGLGHFGHILSLFVRSRAQLPSNSIANSNVDLGEDGELKGPTRVNEVKEPEEMLAIVGDLMRSISLVQYYPEHQTLEEVARDFNANWTCAVEMLNDHVYLGAENWHNLFCLRRNAASASEEIRCRLDTIGEFHLGEMCNKFMAGSLVMPASSSTASSSRRYARRELSPHKKQQANNDSSPNKVAAASRIRRPVVTVGSQTLFGTVDGTLGAILGMDSRTAAFFATIERSMACVIRHVGDFGHQQFRACHAERRVHPAHGFIDGDLVESFLDLDRATMNAVVAEMNRDGGWDFDDVVSRREQDEAGEGGEDLMDLSVDDVLAMIEEMTMLH